MLENGTYPPKFRPFLVGIRNHMIGQAATTLAFLGAEFLVPTQFQTLRRIGDAA